MKLFLLLINAAAFAFMLIDKILAKKHLYRIPERVLLASAIFGGSVGALLGMLFFRHKTRKAKFRYGIPLILALHLTAYLFLQSQNHF